MNLAVAGIVKEQNRNCDSYDPTQVHPGAFWIF
jgi:hypothetical protein